MDGRGAVRACVAECGVASAPLISRNPGRDEWFVARGLRYILMYVCMYIDGWMDGTHPNPILFYPILIELLSWFEKISLLILSFILYSTVQYIVSVSMTVTVHIYIWRCFFFPSTIAPRVGTIYLSILTLTLYVCLDLNLITAYGSRVPLLLLDSDSRLQCQCQCQCESLREGGTIHY